MSCLVEGEEEEKRETGQLDLSRTLVVDSNGAEDTKPCALYCLALLQHCKTLSFFFFFTLNL